MSTSRLLRIRLVLCPESVLMPILILLTLITVTRRSSSVGGPVMWGRRLVVRTLSPTVRPLGLGIGTKTETVGAVAKSSLSGRIASAIMRSISLSSPDSLLVDDKGCLLSGSYEMSPSPRSRISDSRWYKPCSLRSTSEVKLCRHKQRRVKAMMISFTSWSSLASRGINEYAVVASKILVVYPF